MLEEHVALARWGDAALVSRHGEIFNAASEEQLPLFEGPEESSSEMVRQYHAFYRLLRPLQQNIELNEAFSPPCVAGSSGKWNHAGTRT